VDEEFSSVSSGANCELALDDLEKTTDPLSSLGVPMDNAKAGPYSEDDHLPSNPASIS